MRSIRLRSHAIGNYTHPETDAPRAIFVLAIIAAAGVALPWAHGFGWSKRGWSYEQGLVALGAAIAAVCISAARTDRKIARTWFEALALACALAGLGSTLWFYFDVVGATDPASAVIRFYAAFRLQTTGALGLYVSTAGFLAETAVLIWHVDFRIQRRLRLALRSPWTAAALLGVAAIGVLLPWNNSWPTADRGWSLSEGLVALIAAASAIIVCSLRLSGRIRPQPYTLLGLLCAFMGLAAVAWFHQAEIHTLQPTGYPLLVAWANAPRSDNGLRESVTAAGFLGMIAVLVWQLRQGRRSTI